MRKPLLSIIALMVTTFTLTGCSFEETTVKDLPLNSIYMSEKGYLGQAHKFQLITETGAESFQECERNSVWFRKYECLSADGRYRLTYKVVKHNKFSRIKIYKDNKEVAYSCHKQYMSSEVKAYCTPKRASSVSVLFQLLNKRGAETICGTGWIVVE